MQQSQPDSFQICETRARSLAKTLIWRVVATLITWLTLYYYTGRLGESTKITLVAAGVAMVSYYLYERIWNSIGWGRVVSRTAER